VPGTASFEYEDADIPSVASIEMTVDSCDPYHASGCALDFFGNEYCVEVIQ